MITPQALAEAEALRDFGGALALQQPLDMYIVCVCVCVNDYAI